jgi:LysM repeat protein
LGAGRAVTRRAIGALSLLATAVLLAACVGGGSSDATPTAVASPTAVPPLRIVTPTPGGQGAGAPTAAPTAAPGAPAATAAPAQTGQGGKYVVQAGDTLYAIAARFKVTPQALMQANNLSDPSLIHVGQVLTIPSSSP